MIDYRIVYPKGDLSKLTVAPVRSYEVADWCLASQKIFSEDQQDEAWVYCRELAEQNGLETYDDPKGNNHFLD